MAEDSLYTSKYSLPYPATTSDVKPASEDFKNLAVSVESNLSESESRNILRSQAVQAATDQSLGQMGDALADAESSLAAGLSAVDEKLANVSSAYDVWLSEGNVGTRSDYLASLRGERGEEGPYGGTSVTDPQVASYVVDSGSETSTALRQATSPDLLTDLRYPVKIAHRGSRHVYPEHSMEAYDASYAAGYTPEADVRVLADGTLVCIHDGTTGRTMTGTSMSVADMTREDWESRRVLPPSHDHVSGTGYGTPVLFEDYLDRFGGRCVLWPEAKVVAAVAPMMEAIKRRGLTRSTVVQSSSAAGADAVVAAGGTALQLTTSDAAAIAARGVSFVGVPSSASAAYIDSCHAAGLKVIMYTLNTRAAVLTALGKGVDGVFSDDPVEVFRPLIPARHLDFTRDYLTPGMAMDGHSDSSAKVDGGALNIVSPSGRTIVKLGAFGYGADRLRIRFWAQGLSAEREGGWIFGIYAGSADGDIPITESNNDGVQWRLLLCRADGEKRLYRHEKGGSTTLLESQAVTSGDYIPVGAPGPAMQFEVEFTATQVIARNLTRNDEPLVGTAASLSDSGQYLTIAGYYSTVRFWDVQVTRD